MIIIATDVYRRDINNFNVYLIIEQDISMSFDLIIQHMGQASRKKAKSTFIFFISKWSKNQDINNIEIQKSRKENTSRSTQFSNGNKPVAKQASPLCQVSNL